MVFECVVVFGLEGVVGDLVVVVVDGEVGCIWLGFCEWFVDEKVFVG